MRPVLMLFVGTRGVRIADLVDALSVDADVILAISDDHLAGRADTLDGAEQAREVLQAPSLADLCARAIDHPPPLDGVLAFSDDVLHVAATVAAARGLPGQPPDGLDAFRDKYRQRRRLAAAGLPVPAFFEITGLHAVDDALAVVPLPAYLKPTRGSGSSLVHLIDAPEQLAPRLREGLAAVGRAGGAVAEDTAFILEGRLVGQPWHEVEGFAPYVSVESAAVDGAYTHLAVTDRFPLAPPALETGMMLPSGLAEHDQKQVVEAADAALRALDFHHGLAHVELMLTADGPVVIEANARAGGAMPYLFPLAGGPDLVRLAGAVALGTPPPDAPAFSRYAVFVAPQHPVGVRVDRVTGLDEAAGVPGVRAVIPLSAGPGRTDNFQRTMIAAVLGTADSPAGAAALWRQVQGAVRAEYAS